MDDATPPAPDLPAGPARRRGRPSGRCSVRISKAIMRDIEARATRDHRPPAMQLEYYLLLGMRQDPTPPASANG